MKNNVKYFDIKIKKKKMIKLYLKSKFMKLLLASKIKPPTERDYEKIKIATIDVMKKINHLYLKKAMELICNTFTKKKYESKWYY